LAPQRKDIQIGRKIFTAGNNVNFAYSESSFKLLALTGYKPQEEKSHLNCEAIALADW
jgi:hypothetical protein